MSEQELPDAEIARRMLDVLPDESAWIKEHYGPEVGTGATGHCLLGAWMCARYPEGWGSHDLLGEDWRIRRRGSPFLQRLAEIAEEQFPGRSLEDYPLLWTKVHAFNDHEDTTYQDVRLILEKAAACEEVPE